MPIYAYKCTSCGQSKDVLQKISDVPLSVCPFCGESTFTKQVTAAGFQLKGSGWYATDFRGSGTPASAPASDSVEGGSSDAKSDSRSDGKTDAKPTDKKPDSAAKKADAPSTPSAPSTGTTGSGS
jgi:putative FmdB family regulatory protein